MTILLITNNFPPIIDGVGDYTFRLSKEIIKHGHNVHILCSNKNEIVKSQLNVNNLFIHPIVSNWDKTNHDFILKTIDDIKPDWVSLQYVSYAFNKKGLPFSLTGILKPIGKKHKLHIMFHELWVGMDKNAGLLLKTIGVIQKFLIKKMLNNLKPYCINTHTPLYQFQINKLKFKASILPLFGNIPVLNSKDIIKDKNKISLILFGNIHYGAPVTEFLSEIKTYAAKRNKFIHISFVGRNGSEITSWINNTKDLNIKFDIHGEQNPNEISKLLNSADYGISTTPNLLISKSGTAAAMLEHNLTVINVARDWVVNNFKSINQNTNIIHYEIGNLERNLNEYKSNTYTNNIETITYKFLNYLEG